MWRKRKVFLLVEVYIIRNFKETKQRNGAIIKSVGNKNVIGNLPTQYLKQKQKYIMDWYNMFYSDFFHVLNTEKSIQRRQYVKPIGFKWIWMLYNTCNSIQIMKAAFLFVLVSRTVAIEFSRPYNINQCSFDGNRRNNTDIE